MGISSADTDPLLRFETEHRHALRELDRLNAAADALEGGAEAGSQLRIVSEVHEFLTTAVRQHNENEERALFRLLGEDAPVGVFVEEHRTLWDLETRLGEALHAADAARQVPPVAHTIVDLLRAHIAREDEVLFPICRAMLGSDGLARVARSLSAS